MDRRATLNYEQNLKKYVCVDLGFGAMWFHGSMPAFWRNIPPPSSGLK
jgi:hypothetical protein